MHNCLNMVKYKHIQFLPVNQEQDSEVTLDTGSLKLKKHGKAFEKALPCLIT